MEYGVTIFPTDYSITPADLAVSAEERDFDSLWFAEHSHIPVSRLSPWPGGGDLPKMYYDTFDPFVALATAASVTTRIKLCTGICLVVQRDPIHTAKEVATLDHLSKGRMLFGVGAGWNAEEMADHGTDFKRRFKLMRERIEAMQAIWSQEQAEYHGEFVNFEPSWQWPKPVQRPGPRILIGGGAGPKLFAHIAEYADGWMPIGGAGLAAALERLRTAVTERGRDASALHIVPFGTIPDAKKLEYYESVGVTEVVLRLPSSTEKDVLPVLDDYTRFL